MTADPARDELAHLRARLAGLERRWRVPRRHLPLALVAWLVALAALLPAGALADLSFLDLNPGSPHNANIKAI
jgi:hypothetical protein